MVPWLLVQVVYPELLDSSHLEFQMLQPGCPTGKDRLVA